MPTRRDLGPHALVGHGLLAATAIVVLTMFLPVVTGESSGEGAGMGVFLLFYFLGIPLFLVGGATLVLSLHSPRPGLLLPTVLLFVGVPASTVLRSDLALVVALGLYALAVLRAVVLRLRLRGRSDT